MQVEKDRGITDDLPDQLGDYHVEYMDTRQLIARCKKLRKEFSVLKIQPAKTKGAPLKVLVYWVSHKKDKLNLGLSDWSEVGIRYDCAKAALHRFQR